MRTSLVTLIAELSLLQVDFGSQRPEVRVETLLASEGQIGVIDVERLVVDVISPVLQERDGASFSEARGLLGASVSARLLDFGQGIHGVPAVALSSRWLVAARVVLLARDRVQFGIEQALRSILINCVFASDTRLERSKSNCVTQVKV